MKHLLLLITLVSSLAIISCDETNTNTDTNTQDSLNDSINNDNTTVIENDVTTSDEALSVLVEQSQASQEFKMASISSDAAIAEEQASLPSTRIAADNTEEKPKITITPLLGFPKTVIIDFEDGKTGLDGITRKGKLNVVMSNWRDSIGSTHTLTFEDYYQNGNKVEGTHVSTNISDVENTDSFHVIITDGKVTLADGRIITYSEESTRVLVEGNDTKLYVWDNIYRIYGEQQGLSSDSIDYTFDIIEPLKVSVIDQEISEGIALLDIGTIEDIEVNYTEQTITMYGITSPMN